MNQTSTNGVLGSIENFLTSIAQGATGAPLGPPQAIPQPVTPAAPAQAPANHTLGTLAIVGMAVLLFTGLKK